MTQFDQAASYSEKPVGTGEQTGQQTVFGVPGLQGVAGVLTGLFPGLGMGFGAGFGSAYYNGFGAIGVGGGGWPLASWSNYELMDRNPTVCCAQAVADAPGCAVELAYETKPQATEEMTEFIREQMDPWVRILLKYGMRCQDDGFAAMEIIFSDTMVTVGSRRRVMTTLEKCKPLFPWATTPIVDKKGNLMGIQNQGTRINDPRNCLWIPYDDRSVYLFGRSRRNNYGKAWLAEEFLYDFLQYAMGVMVRPFGDISYPFNPNGSDEAAQSNAAALKNAKTIGEGLANGQFTMSPNPFATLVEQMVQQGLKPDDLRPYKISWHETKGDHGEAFERLFRITGAGIVMGHLRPPRSMLESQYGSRADAQSHGDVGMLVGDQVVQLIVRHLNLIVDTLLIQNYGIEYKGAVWIQPAKIGSQMEMTTELVLSLFKTMPPALLLRMVDLSAEFERAGVKVSNFKVEEIIAELDKRDAAQRAVKVDSQNRTSKEKKAGIENLEYLGPGTIPPGTMEAAKKLNEYFVGQRGKEWGPEARKKEDDRLTALLLLLLAPWWDESAIATARALGGSPGLAAEAIRQIGARSSAFARELAVGLNDVTWRAGSKQDPEGIISVDTLYWDDPAVATRTRIIAEDLAYKAKMDGQLAVMGVMSSLSQPPSVRVVGWNWLAYPDACKGVCRPLNGQFFPISEWGDWVNNPKRPGYVHTGCRCRVEVVFDNGTTVIL